VRILAAALAIVINLVLARCLGIAEFGRFSYGMTWIWLLGTLGASGLDRLLVRYIAEYDSREAWRSLDGLLSWANRAAIIVGACLCGLIFGISILLSKGQNGSLYQTLEVVCVSVPLLVVLRTRQAVLRGLNRIALSQISESRFVTPKQARAVLSLAWAGHGRR
jgi:O-antigen/teichoic acid export membrane protein